MIHHLIAAFRGAMLLILTLTPFPTYAYIRTPLRMRKRSSETAATYVKHSFIFFFHRIICPYRGRGGLVQNHLNRPTLRSGGRRRRRRFWCEKKRETLLHTTLNALRIAYLEERRNPRYMSQHRSSVREVRRLRCLDCAPPVHVQ